MAPARLCGPFTRIRWNGGSRAELRRSDGVRCGSPSTSDAKQPFTDRSADFPYRTATDQGTRLRRWSPAAHRRPHATADVPVRARHRRLPESPRSPQGTEPPSDPERFGGGRAGGGAPRAGWEAGAARRDGPPARPRLLGRCLPAVLPERLLEQLGVVAEVGVDQSAGPGRPCLLGGHLGRRTRRAAEIRRRTRPGAEAARRPRGRARSGLGGVRGQGPGPVPGLRAVAVRGRRPRGLPPAAGGAAGTGRLFPKAQGSRGTSFTTRFRGAGTDAVGRPCLTRSLLRSRAYFTTVIRSAAGGAIGLFADELAVR